MPLNRVACRNIHICDSATGATLGGVCQNGSITEANFLWILAHILLVVDAPFSVRHRDSGQSISSTLNPVKPGIYDVHCDETININNEPWVERIMSHSISGREDSFRDGIRERDRKCVVSGITNTPSRISRHNWSGFEVAHIFPLEKENIWLQGNFGCWITDMDNTTGVTKINSYQNGFLLYGGYHTDFDNYLFSVNPDITVFDDDITGLDGKFLDPVCRDSTDPHRVSDQLLRWHFRQSVLANMRGAGEPIFEHDFPPGTDMVGEIRDGPYARERFEMEIAARLR